MIRSIYSPIVTDVPPERRKEVQNDFGRHIVEQRNRAVTQVREWLEGRRECPMPIYRRHVERVKELDATARSDSLAVAVMAADFVLSAVLTTFDLGDDMRVDAGCVNYAVVAQKRDAVSEGCAGGSRRESRRAGDCDLEILREMVEPV